MNKQFTLTLIFSFFSLITIYAQPGFCLEGTVSTTNETCEGSQDGTISVQAFIEGVLTSITVTDENGNGILGQIVEVEPTLWSMINLGSGTYVVTAEDDQGCSLSPQTVAIGSSPAFVLNCSSANPAYPSNDNLGTANITIGAESFNYPFNYSYTGPVSGQGSWDGEDDGFPLPPLPVGTYALEVTDETGCQATCNFTIEDGCIFFSVNTDQTDVSCNGFSDGAISIETGEVGADFSWNPASIGNTGNPTDLSAGTYPVTITENFTECVIDTAFIINEPEAVTIQCILLAPDAGGSDGGTGIVQLTGAGGTPFYFASWTGPTSGQIDIGANPVEVDNLVAGDYLFTITDANNCTAECEITVLPACIEFTYTIIQTDINCFGENDGTATIVPSGGATPYIINWDTDALPNTFEQTGLSPGTYSFTITDEIGCDTTGSITISQTTTAIVIEETVSPISCNGEQDGGIVVAVSGGTEPYNISWNNNLTENFAQNGLGPNTYAYTVSDAQQCTETGSVVIVDPTALSGIGTATAADTDQEEPNGKAEVVITGGTPPYSAQWTGPSPDSSENIFGENTTFDINNLEAGLYNLTITDSQDCEVTDTFFINEVFVFTPSGADTLLVVEFDADANPDTIRAVYQQLEDDGGILLDSCNCGAADDLVPRLTLWTSRATLELNANNKGGEGRPKGDTSGIGKIIIIEEQVDNSIETDNCVYPVAISTGQKEISVALIDSGIDLLSPLNRDGHPALGNIFWLNDGEVANNRLDDDNNCIADDTEGYDFTGNSVVVEDKVGHGTHIAGIISSAFPEDVKLEMMNLKIFEDENSGKVFDLICAIHYAINQGAKIINLSLGYVNELPSRTLYNALKRAEDNGILVVVSAGNDNTNLNLSIDDPTLNRWPGRFNQFTNKIGDITPLNNIIVVAALNEAETAVDTSASNYGSMYADIATRGTFNSTIQGGDYAVYSGTSMAAGYLTRVAAIAIAANDTLSPPYIIDVIRNTSDVDSLNISEDPTSLRGNFLIAKNGKLNPQAALETLTNNRVNFERPLIVPPADDPQFLRIEETQFLDNTQIDFQITLGDGQTLYDNVQLVITTFPAGGPVVTINYCATSSVQWFGDNDNGDLVPGGQYDYEVIVNGSSYTVPNKISVGK